MADHYDKGNGWCGVCGCAYPCPYSREAAESVGDNLRPKKR